MILYDCVCVCVCGYEVQENCFLPCGCADALGWLSCHKNPERGVVQVSYSFLLAHHIPHQQTHFPPEQSSPPPTPTPPPTTSHQLLYHELFKSTSSTCASSPWANRENNNTADGTTEGHSQPGTERRTVCIHVFVSEGRHSRGFVCI